MNNVQILMSTYNGENYLSEQLESIINQKNVNIQILIRDDGSKDKTLDIINEYIRKYPNIIRVYSGDNLGPAKSFMDLIFNADDVDYYAFSDQDDYWDENKISHAINMLKNQDRPSLYMSSLNVVDENLNFLYKSKIRKKRDFKSELLKNYATGCTQVFNKKMREIIKMHNPSFIMMHDSWITRLCYIVNGNVIIDDDSFICYRQHQNNVLGYKENYLKKFIKQLKIAFKDNIRIRENIAQELLNGYSDYIDKDNLEILDIVINYKSDFRKKIKYLFKFSTGNMIIDLKIKMAILLNKF